MSLGHRRGSHSVDVDAYEKYSGFAQCGHGQDADRLGGNESGIATGCRKQEALAATFA